MQKLDMKRFQLMTAAEKRTGRGRMKGMFWFLVKLNNAKTELSKAYDGI